MRAWPFLLLTVLLTACTTDAYESGDGRYSYLRADFVEAHTVAAGEADKALTDEGERLTLQPHVTAPWMEKADTVYRALLYYNKVDATCQPVSVARVPVLRAIGQEKLEGPAKTDPVGLESLWVSADGRYVNLGLTVKTGQSDDPEAAQTIGLMEEKEEEGTLFMRLLHDQGGIPEYYSSRVYVSIPIDERLKGHTLHLTVATYAGDVERTVQL